MDKVKVAQILTDAIAAPANGSSIQPWSNNKVFQATGSVTAGAGSATVLIQGSLDGSTWETIDTLTVTITNSTGLYSDFGAVNQAWPYMRARITAIAGTNATINVYLACDGD